MCSVDELNGIGGRDMPCAKQTDPHESEKPIEVVRELGSQAVEATTPALISSRAEHRALVVDLDGTLLLSDLLIETAFAQIGRSPLSTLGALAALGKGKAALKHWLAERAEVDPAALPYDEVVLARIRQAASAGQPVYLASASGQRLVEAVADHLKLFNGWFASDETENLSGEAKARRLVAEFGERGFDYIGNSAADLRVWSRAETALVIGASRSVKTRLAKSEGKVEYLHRQRAGWRDWVRLLRVHQYAKNALLLIPLLTAHQFSFGPLLTAFAAIVAFALCASSVYILNDLADLTADRIHPTKFKRPLASGTIPLIHGIIASPVLLALAVVISSFISVPFLAVLVGYFALTTAYSFFLKRKMLIDTITLALLYVIRVVAGAVAINVVVSEWLLAFSMFMFLSLALVKRYVELAIGLDSGKQDLANRNYRIGDLEVVAALAAAAGFNAVTVFALYISSSTVHELYRRPAVLWLICPILLYWIGRTLLMAHRRLMNDDPILFALRDWNSWLAGGAIALLFMAAL